MTTILLAVMAASAVVFPIIKSHLRHRFTQITTVITRNKVNLNYKICSSASINCIYANKTTREISTLNTSGSTNSCARNILNRMYCKSFKITGLSGINILVIRQFIILANNICQHICVVISNVKHKIQHVVSTQYITGNSRVRRLRRRARIRI
ncbi:MAG: hypothetical protein [Cressdnaviricota sp.]|nr:MAG: hypothetical protein [Cressdnaviricota sp.]